jgi:hypothetical protein
MHRRNYPEILKLSSDRGRYLSTNAPRAKGKSLEDCESPFNLCSKVASQNRLRAGLKIAECGLWIERPAASLA